MCGPPGYGSLTRCGSGAPSRRLRASGRCEGPECNRRAGRRWWPPSGGPLEGVGRDGEAEGDEPAHAVLASNRVGDHEAELAEEVVEVAVAAGAAHEGFPVVVEGLDAPR